MASIRITRMNRTNDLRTRLLYPDCPIRRGNMPARYLSTYRSHRRSEVNPSSADITAIVSSSASLSVGGMPRRPDGPGQDPASPSACHRS